ncbi:MAG: [FeFe] hydrogenase H-cluster radical SAM maturase HydE [Prolixibacteraceae bacterium]|jgi:biotin synthase|nr:[FeFe] hydrogenase H-cluster radical SAM maturase HydE [Prolixibacteraceae bacterium]
MKLVSNILKQETYSKADLIQLLESKGDDRALFFKKAQEAKLKYVGKNVFFRGLIEFSNICSKDCYYCGIRNSNANVKRYNLTDDEIISAAKFAYKNKYGSLVLQAGELVSSAFSDRIEKLLNEIKKVSNNELGVTLSVGEQSEETYQRWFNAGAHRFLLRIETSNSELYKKLHPSDHSFSNRLQCLKSLQKIGYQTGTGVMIGLPFQTISDLADDLLFMKEFDVDMVGMGPFIEHSETPLYAYKDELWPIEERFDTTLKMIAILRLMMKDINIAAATALQAIDPLGREKAIRIGANIIMPNITPGFYRNDYALYQNKPCVDEEPEQCMGCLDARLALADSDIGYSEWGDSKHFFLRTSS